LLDRDVLKGIHVLIAEDNDDARELLEVVLAHAAARVTSARDGESALEAIQRLLPDVVLADLGMPARDGFWLIEQLRGLPAHSGGLIPAIAVSAMVAPADIQRAKALGYTAHVSKPANPAELAMIIADVVGRRPAPKS